MNPIKALEVFAVCVAVIGSGISALLFLDARHTSNLKMIEHELYELDGDIKSHNEARIYYQDKVRDGNADSADMRRKEFVEEKLDQMYKEREMLYQQKLDMEN